MTPETTRRPQRPAAVPILRTQEIAPIPAGAPGSSAFQNNRTLLLLSTPLLAVAALCLLTAAKRVAIDPLIDRPFGTLSRTQASQMAGKLCTRLTGEAARPVDASAQAAFSCRRKSVVREWDVVCNTAGGQYLLRINADSGAVCAVNRLQDWRPQAGGYAIGYPAGPPANEAEEEARLSGEENMLTRAQAEARAMQYLSLIGVSKDGLRVVGEPDRVINDGANPVVAAADPGAKPARAGIEASCLWNFTFRRRVPGIGDRLLKISIDGRDGELEHVWNPVSAL